MKYGTSAHYQGDKGADYFEYQNRYAAKRAALKYQRFSKYISAQDMVLDFGCGGGWLLAEADCAVRVGVEVNQSAHATCEANGVKVYEEISSVEEKNFDVIISCHCLEHVPYPIEALSSLSQLLKPEGKLVLIVPIDDWRAQKRFIRNDVDRHLYTWTPRLLGNALVDAGYEVEDVHVFTRQWFPKWNLLIGRIPPALFSLFCILWGWCGKQREIRAVAVKKHVSRIGPMPEFEERSGLSTGVFR